MTAINHRFVETNGIRMHVAEAGEGPLVVLCHGFPESWYSWRHQLTALAEAGFHAVAPDQRGYGQTDRPTEIEKYTQIHLVGDILGLLDALDEQTAVIVGHDWGAPVAWNSALLRPDRFPAVVGLSVPYAPRGAIKPTDGMKAAFGDNFFYILYFQEPGKAEAELEADPRRTQRTLLYSASGNRPRPETPPAPLPKTAGFLDAMEDPAELPSWLTESDLDFVSSEFERTGFTGGLNWYRCIDRTWELMAPFHGQKIHVPSLFVAGDRDGVIAMNPAGYEQLETHIPRLRKKVLLPGVGHWTQQEAPDEVNRELIAFLKQL
jgi:pimeloyl-ACP methyl ester carboxylesterase